MVDTDQDFAAQLPIWRKRVDVSRTDVDKAIEAAGIEVPARFTSQLENRRLRCPDRNVCAVIAGLVKMPEWEVWKVSALERIRKADALDFHLEEIARSRPYHSNVTGEDFPTSRRERDLLNQIRGLESYTAPGERSVAELVDVLLHTLDVIGAQHEIRGYAHRWLQAIGEAHPQVELPQLLRLMSIAWESARPAPVEQRPWLLQEAVGAVWGIYAMRAAAGQREVRRSLNALDRLIRESLPPVGEARATHATTPDKSQVGPTSGDEPSE
jgi:hypothetical protein